MEHRDQVFVGALVLGWIDVLILLKILASR
jgi:hypothetical protein